MPEITNTAQEAFSDDDLAVLAGELTGQEPSSLLKIRTTATGLIVIIATGQKYIYHHDAIAPALQRIDGAHGKRQAVYRTRLAAEIAADDARLAQAFSRAAELPPPAPVVPPIDTPDPSLRPPLNYRPGAPNPKRPRGPKAK